MYIMMKIIPLNVIRGEVTWASFAMVLSPRVASKGHDYRVVTLDQTGLYCCVNETQVDTKQHQLCHLMIEITRSQMQAGKMSFLRRVAVRTLRDRMRSSVNWKELRVELLLLIKSGQKKRWRDYVSWPGNALGSRWIIWRRWLGTGRFECLCSDCCPHDLALDNGRRRRNPALGNDPPGLAAVSYAVFSCFLDMKTGWRKAPSVCRCLNNRKPNWQTKMPWFGEVGWSRF